ncbi:hypothetical protein [Candidatus Methylobacter favarea]|uniref:hypothetical protein n=1 Tax=Candidatus Methylobacter favarea TaxID=2707345 RepID=UPI00157D941F|nr:hypothetical protein [Candidatus Methylobacter favarea]
MKDFNASCSRLHLKPALLEIKKRFLLKSAANKESDIATLFATVLAFIDTCLH